MSEHLPPHAARTDVGRRREHNEDALLVQHPLYAVADGVGGSARGEVASNLALEVLGSHARAIGASSSADDARQALEAAVLAANGAVHDAQGADEDLRGMATTLVAVLVRAGGELVVGHVGDSRAYLISTTGVRQLTDDHSVVGELVRSGRLDEQEAAAHPHRNVITRALGPEPDVTVDAFHDHAGPGDWIVLCTDGLSGLVDDEEIGRAMLENGRLDPQAAVDRLVDQANVRGGTDNITVVAVQPVPSDVDDTLATRPLEVATAPAAGTRSSLPSADGVGVGVGTPTTSADGSPSVGDRLEGAPYHDPDGVAIRSRRLRTVIAVLLLLLLAFAGGAFVWSQSYFLLEREDGTVGVDQGFPLPWLHHPHAAGPVQADRLGQADRERIVESHRLLSEEEARRVLEGLPDRVEEDDPAAERSIERLGEGRDAPGDPATAGSRRDAPAA